MSRTTDLEIRMKTYEALSSGNKTGRLSFQKFYKRL